MKIDKQVSKTHYSFINYMSPGRWASIWYQLSEIIKLNPAKTLEIGPGAGVLKGVASLYDITIETIDIDPELSPDYIGSALALPFQDNSFDLVCAFQMLEHLPYADSIKVFQEMIRVSRDRVILSLPDARVMWKYEIYLPMIGARTLFIPRPQFRAVTHQFDGQHYWELNKKDYELKKVVCDLSKHASLERTFRPVENMYHRFFIFKKSAI